VGFGSPFLFLYILIITTFLTTPFLKASALEQMKNKKEQ